MIKDIHIREKLLTENLVKYSTDPECKVIQELGLCQGLTRIDIAVVNGSLVGYEIKSQSDTLIRLSDQLHIYTQTLEYLILVIHSSHLEKAQTMIPDWCGIIEVISSKDELIFKNRRKPRKNKNQDPYSLVQLLWKDEAYRILETKGLAQGLKNKPRSILWAKLADACTINELNTLVKTTIKTRNNWRESLPHE